MTTMNLNDECLPPRSIKYESQIRKTLSKYRWEDTTSLLSRRDQNWAKPDVKAGTSNDLRRLKGERLNLFRKEPL